MTRLWLERPFSASHQIRIAGELEPVHGHDFRCRIDVVADEALDASALEPALALVLSELSHSHLEAVERAEGGRASAERIARWIHRALGPALAASAPGATRIERVTVHESPGCSASWAECAT